MDDVEVRRRRTGLPGPVDPLESRSQRREEERSYRRRAIERAPLACPLLTQLVPAQTAPQASAPALACSSNLNAALSPRAMQIRPARRPRRAPTLTCHPGPSFSALQAELTERKQAEADKDWREQRLAIRAASPAATA